MNQDNNNHLEYSNDQKIALEEFKRDELILQAEIIKNFHSYKSNETTKILQIFHVIGAANIAFLSFQTENMLSVATPYLIMSPFIFSFSFLFLAYLSFYVTDSANYYHAVSVTEIPFYEFQDHKLQKSGLIIAKQKIEKINNQEEQFRTISIIGQWICFGCGLLSYLCFLGGIAILSFPKIRTLLSSGSFCMEQIILKIWMGITLLTLIGLIYLFSKISNDKL